MRVGWLGVMLLACGSGDPASPGSPLGKPARPAKDPGRIELATTPGTVPYGVAVDGVYVYFSTVDVGLHRTPKLGGTVELLAPDDHGPHIIFIDEAWVYSADFGTPANDFHDGRVSRVRKTGGALQILAEPYPQAGQVRIRGGDLFFSSIGTRSFGLYNHDGAIYRMPKDGSSPPVRLAKDQDHPVGMAVDETYVYWTNSYEGTVMRCAIAGCGEKPAVLYDLQLEPRSLTQDGDWLYWANQQAPDSSGPNVVRARKDGKGPIVELAASRGYPSSLVIDREDLYWTETLTHTVMHLSKHGDFRPDAVAADLGLPVMVAVDETSVYFTDQLAANVVRVPR